MDPKNTAILVIDMQEDFLTPRDSYLTQISKIKRLLAVGRIRNIPAFVIEYVNCGKTLDEFSPTASGNSSLLTKSNEDSFKNTGLEKRLKDREIKTLIVSGVYANCCVMATTISAINAGFQVHTSKDLINDQYPHEFSESLNWYQKNVNFFPDLSAILA